MSIVKRFEIVCDRCKCHREWSQEMIANSRGITKGGGVTELRKEAKKAGWERRKLRPGVWIDLCYPCSHYETPKTVWFEVYDESEAYQ